MSRLLALKVACLTAMDREWLLCSLTAHQRDQLEPLLAQIEALGLHRDPSILRQLAEVQSEVNSENMVINENRVKAMPPFWLAFMSKDVKKLATVEQLSYLSTRTDDLHVPAELSACLNEYVAASVTSADGYSTCHK